MLVAGAIAATQRRCRLPGGDATPDSAMRASGRVLGARQAAPRSRASGAARRSPCGATPRARGATAAGTTRAGRLPPHRPHHPTTAADATRRRPDSSLTIELRARLGNTRARPPGRQSRAGAGVPRRAGPAGPPRPAHRGARRQQGTLARPLRAATTPFGARSRRRVRTPLPCQRLSRARRAGLRDNGSSCVRRLTGQEVTRMKNVTTNALMVLLSGAAAGLGCSGGGSLYIGNTQAIGASALRLRGQLGRLPHRPTTFFARTWLGPRPADHRRQRPRKPADRERRAAPDADRPERRVPDGDLLAHGRCGSGGRVSLSDLRRPGSGRSRSGGDRSR